MSADQPQYPELSCRVCRWTEACGPTAMIRWLRATGKLRPQADLELELLYELFRVHAAGFACPACGNVGLAVGEAIDDWSEDRRCEACGRTIAPERLEFLPNATLCASCQQDEERGRGKREHDYCPRCGAVMELRRAATGGVTRYVLSCPACRR